MTSQSMLTADAIEEHMPLVMGVLNMTPDSFYAASRASGVESAVDMAAQMVEDGARILDVGGEATNPMLDVTESQVSPEEECERVVGVIEALSSRFDAAISVDTSKPEVMAAAVAAGANMINDQRALTRPGALEQAAKLHVPVCLMHMYGLHTREPNAQPYTQTLEEIKAALLERAACALEAGISKEHIIIDPGFGHGNYGKSTEENLYLLGQLDVFVDAEYPVLVGFSRKTMIGEVLDLPPAKRLPGSLSLAVLAMLSGAAIIRTHDVAETTQALKMVAAVQAVSV